MFLATLKELNLFVLPKPNFDIPASDCDFICPHPRTGDSDLSCVSHTFDMQEFDQIENVRERRRNTITFPLHKTRENFWPPVSPDKRPPSTANRPDKLPSIRDSQDPGTRFLDNFANGIASIMHTRSSESSSGAKVRIVAPASSPSSIRRRLREDLLSLYGSSPNCDRSRTHCSRTKVPNVCENKRNMRYGLSRKGKEKRYSAPAVVQTNKQPISPTQLPPPVIQKYQNQRLRSHQDMATNPSHPSKLFELDLSPIIEDVYALSDQLPALFTEGAQTDAGSVDSPLNSSTTSYGELLYDKLTNLPKSADSFGVSDFELFGDQKPQWIETEHRGSQEWHGLTLTSMRDETVKNRRYRVPGETLPKLTLTLPTPAFDCSAEFMNFGVEALRGQPSGELPRSSSNLRADVVDLGQARARYSPPLVHSSYPDNDAFQTYDPESYGTMDTLSHLDLVTSSGSVDGSVLELDRSCHDTPSVIRPASLVAQNPIGRARRPSTNADSPVLSDPATRRLGNGLSRFGRYLLRRIKLFSLSGNKHHTSNSNGKELWSVKRVTRVFSIRSDQPRTRRL